MGDENSARSFPRSVGLCRLIEELQLQVPLPATRSEIVAGARKTVAADGKILEQYPRNYAPKEPFGELRFALRYEPVALDVYLAIFQTINAHQLEEWIRSEPTGIFTRRAWYLYELLMEKHLDVPDVIPSGYIDLLDPKIHLTGPRRLVRRTDALIILMDKELAAEAQAIVQSCDPVIQARAVHYLFTKETKSSFAIEGEEPSKDRTERFVAALMKTSGFDATSKDAFVQLQKAIVDPRYAQKNWHTAQNYVSQTLQDYSVDVHFVCPKPEDVPSLMDS